MLREGVIVGVLGASVVAVWFLAFAVGRGRPFLTPALLGAAVFYGVNTPIGPEILPPYQSASGSGSPSKAPAGSGTEG